MTKAKVDNNKYGKVAVLMGGLSAEREISLRSGAAVLKALLEKGINAHKIDVGSDIIQQLIDGNFDLVFNMLHGRKGEDGVIQGALELLDLPYTGSGVLASSVGMDKLKTKEIWLANNLPTPDFIVITKNSNLDEVTSSLNFPVIVKPLNEGSSIGMSKVSVMNELKAAIDLALQYDEKVLVEKWIVGNEYTAAIVAGESLPLIRLETENTFYDYDAKYVSGTTQYHCPCGLESSEELALQKLAVKAFDAISANGWGRVDFMVDENNNPYLIEINTLPGMTNTSLVPMAAKQAGYDFETLVLNILEAGYQHSGQGK